MGQATLQSQKKKLVHDMIQIHITMTNKTYQSQSQFFSSQRISLHAERDFACKAKQYQAIIGC